MKSIVALSLLALAASASAAARNVIEPPMAAIPAGEFLMGDPQAPAPGGMQPVAGPQHKVRVQAFRMAKYELTIKEFRQFVDATGYNAGNSKGECWKWVKPGAGGHAGVPLAMAPGRWNSPEYAPSDYHPVMCVSWNDAQAYVQWLSAQTGKNYRLPSEAEWEYAARAGASGKYPGDASPAAMCRHANMFDASGHAAFARDRGWERKMPACEDGTPYTSVVGKYEPNAFGLFDMLGNVGEYVQDCQHQDYTGAPTDGSAWTASCLDGHGSRMVIHRGGSYGMGLNDNNFVSRGHAGADNHSSLGEGIRLALDAGDDVSASAVAFEAELSRARK